MLPVRHFQGSGEEVMYRMNAYTDKRASERLRFTAAIEFSYFNREHFYNAQTLNHCDEGMCIKSAVALKPGATVCIRLKKIPPDGASRRAYRGLRLFTMAEAKWCREIRIKTDHFYEIGVKYFQPEY